MNREIKFRGQRTDGKGWVCGDFLRDMQGTGYFIREYYEIRTDYLEPGEHVLEDVEVDPATVGQLVSTHEHHGEIYEGDLFKNTGGRIYQVFWNGGYKSIDDGTPHMGDVSGRLFATYGRIGNIHEQKQEA